MDEEEGRGTLTTPPVPGNHQEEGTGGDDHQNSSEHFSLSPQAEG